MGRKVSVVFKYCCSIFPVSSVSNMDMHMRCQLQSFSNLLSVPGHSCIAFVDPSVISLICLCVTCVFIKYKCNFARLSCPLSSSLRVSRLWLLRGRCFFRFPNNTRTYLFVSHSVWKHRLVRCITRLEWVLEVRAEGGSAAPQRNNNHWRSVIPFAHCNIK